MPNFDRFPIPNPIDAERICIKLNIPNTPEHIRQLHTQLDYLSRWTSYDQTGDTKAKQIARVWRSVINNIDWSANDCGECGQGDCIEYANNATIIEWHPNNPHTGQPSTVAGYPQPPWYKIIAGLIGGIEKGDVISDLTTLVPLDFTDWFDWIIHLPELLLNSGLPRFRVHMSGTGQVELHMIQVPQGGFALIWYDDKPHTAELVSLQSISAGSVVSLTALVNIILGVATGNVDITPDVVHEIEITEPGEHYIDVVLIPNITLEITDAGWGGGLRKVVLCGFDEITKPCDDCEPRTDDDKIIEDWLDEIGILEPEELMNFVACAMPFVGQIVAGLVAPGVSGWLKLDGSVVNKADWPQLWQAIGSSLVSDDLTFTLPDFTDRLIIGAGTIAAILEQAGADEVNLDTVNLPTHAHETSDHTHTLPTHRHNETPHTHPVSLPSHQHSFTLPNHTHPVTVPAHAHTVPGRNNSALGSSGRFGITNGTGTVNDATSTSTEAAQNLTTGNGGAGTHNTASGGAADIETVSNIASETSAGKKADGFAFNETNEGGAGTSSEVGDNQPFSIIPPVVGVYYFVFGGCNGADC